MALTGENRNFRLKFKFKLSIEGIVRGAFKSCSALSIEHETIEHYEGGASVPTYKGPGKASFPDVTLERGLTQDLDMYKWVMETTNASVDSPLEPGIGSGVGLPNNQFKRTVDIIQLDRDGTILDRYRLFGAWPKSLSIGEWDNDSNEVAMETLVLAFDYWKRL